MRSRKITIVIVAAAATCWLGLFALIRAGFHVYRVREKKLYVDSREMRDPCAVHEDARVYPNNPSLPEPCRSRDHFGPIQLQDDEFFVLGDNRDHAFDSRYHGAVARQDIVGKVVLVASLQNGVWRPSAAPPTATP